MSNLHSAPLSRALLATTGLVALCCGVPGGPIRAADGTLERAAVIAQDPDNKVPPQRRSYTVFGRPLIVGGRLEFEPDAQTRFRLGDGRRENDRVRAVERLELELLYALRPDVSLFFKPKPFYQSNLWSENGAREVERGVEWGEAWLYWAQPAGLSLRLQAGRQNFRDKREWWWDDELDALHVRTLRDPYLLELAVAKAVAGRGTHAQAVAPEDDDVLRLLGRARWEWTRKNRLEAFYLYQRDGSRRPRPDQVLRSTHTDDSDADLWWAGLRAMGRFRLPDRSRLHYWVDTAMVEGDERFYDFDRIGGGLSEVDDRYDLHIHGWAVDLGLTWETRLPARPSFTAGYALGSGDVDRESGRTTGFRQTGLQDNNNKFRGVDRFRFYGEALRPELANLEIWTAAVGVPFLRSSSVEVLFHRYRQDRAAAGRLRDADIRASTTGADKDVGHEVDVVVGLEEWDRLQVEFVLARFRGGAAFGPLEGRYATRAILEIKYNF